MPKSQNSKTDSFWLKYLVTKWKHLSRKCLIIVDFQNDH